MPARENRPLVAFTLFALGFGILAVMGHTDAAPICLGAQLGIVVGRITKGKGL